jgi:uncharacterized membrane protein (UPF0127 family)
MPRSARLRRTVRVIAAGLLAAIGGAVAACASSDSPTGPGGPDTTGTPGAIAVTFGVAATVKAELATTGAQRATGLMNRASIAADSGMLFAWPVAQNNQFTGFYMLNTHFDLSIAFISADKHVINIEDMDHDTETLHFATAPFQYAVEAPRGWFAAHGVVPGALVTFTIPAGVIIE